MRINNIYIIYHAFIYRGFEKNLYILYIFHVIIDNLRLDMYRLYFQILYTFFRNAVLHGKMRIVCVEIFLCKISTCLQQAIISMVDCVDMIIIL